MSTLIGSSDTNIQISDDLGIQIYVGGVQAFTLSAGGTAGEVVQEYALVSYVNNQTLNDLSQQIADYDCQGYKITGLGAPTSNLDAVNKQYVDDVSAISEGFANISV